MIGAFIIVKIFYYEWLITKHLKKCFIFTQIKLRGLLVKKIKTKKLHKLEYK